MRRRIGQIDLDTGELLEGTLAYLGTRIRSPYARGFVMTNPHALEQIAKDKELAGLPLRILMYLCSRLDFENYIQLMQTEIVEDLGIQKSDVSRSMKKLENKQIILRGPKVGHTYVWRLNPNFGWKGKVVNFEKARREVEREHLKLVRETPRSEQQELEDAGQGRLL